MMKLSYVMGSVNINDSYIQRMKGLIKENVIMKENYRNKFRLFSSSTNFLYCDPQMIVFRDKTTDIVLTRK